MAAPTVIFDSCVFYPASLRDVLLELSTERIFQARWTATIHEEWTRNLLANAQAGSPLTAKKLAYTCELMNRAVPDCLVGGFEHLIDSLHLPDPDDRHVLAAAIVAKANTIVTMNLKDFPEEALAPFGIEAVSPDEFLIHQFRTAPDITLNAIRRLRARLKRPPKTADEYLETLANLRLTTFVTKLRTCKKLI